MRKYKKINKGDQALQVEEIKKTAAAIRFDYKPEPQEIIDSIAKINPKLLGNDRNACYLYELIALNNGYTLQTLPVLSYIGTELLRYKQNHDIVIKLSDPVNKLVFSLTSRDLKKYRVLIDKHNKLRTINDKIFDYIWTHCRYVFDDDKLLVKVFDSIALNSGLSYHKLPHSWNIVKFGHNYKSFVEKYGQFPDMPESVRPDLKTVVVDHRLLEIPLDELKIHIKIKKKLKLFNVKTVADVLALDYTFYRDNQMDTSVKEKIFDSIAKLGLTPGVKYLPSTGELPEFYTRIISAVFEPEIAEFLDKYKIKNVGLLAAQFPDLIIKDNDAMENPKVFEYIDKITDFFNERGITELPVFFSKFEMVDLSYPSRDEIYSINYIEDLVNSIREHFVKIKSNEQDVITRRYGFNDGIKRTLDEVAKVYKVSRERIRQLERAGLSRIRKGIGGRFEKLDEFIRIIFSQKNYNYIECELHDNLVNYGAFIDLLLNSMNASFYIDFRLGLIIKNGVTLEDLLNDDSVSRELKSKIEKYTSRTFLMIGDEKVNNKKEDILNYFLRHYCLDIVHFDEFQGIYLNFLKSLDIDGYEYLLFDNLTLYNKLTFMDCILLSKGRRIRYYDVNSAKELVKKLDLKRYGEVEISSKKVYLDNLDLMQEYNIKNEYELHNLLKKHLNDSNVTFSRMPIMYFGTINRKKQILDLLDELSPVKSIEYMAAYRERYGIAINIFIANYAHYIRKYLVNGYYVYKHNKTLQT